MAQRDIAHAHLLTRAQQKTALSHDIYNTQTDHKQFQHVLTTREVTGVNVLVLALPFQCARPFIIFLITFRYIVAIHR